MKATIIAVSLMLYFVMMTGSPTIAASTSQGYAIIRIDEQDVKPLCINSLTDRISLTTRKVIVDKDVGIFSEDKQAAVVVRTSVIGLDKDQNSKKVVFPRFYVTSVQRFDDGQVALPFEEILFNRFGLQHEGNEYSGAEIEFMVAMKRDKTPFGSALTALADITKTLPGPISPFSEGFRLFANYANKVVEDGLNESNNVAGTAEQGKVAMVFASSNNCTGDQETTGTLAVVRSVKGSESNGIIDVRGEYCFRAEFKPVFLVKFTRGLKSTCFARADSSFTVLRNPYIAFMVNAVPKSIAPVASTSSPFLSLLSEKYLPAYEVGLKPKQNLSNAEVENIVASYTGKLENVHTSKRFEISERLTSEIRSPDSIWPTIDKGKISKGFALVTNVQKYQAYQVLQAGLRCKQHGLDSSFCF